MRTAWLGDDAYITYRTIDNWVHGYGLRWNVNERVQGYTHPLWLLLLTPFYALSHEMFLTALLVSMAISLAAVAVLMFSVARSTQLATTCGVLLLFSRAFTDYSTSGLENPLTHLLLALFVALRPRASGPRGLGLLGLIVALAMLTRMDTVLLYAPALGLAFWRVRSRASALWLAASFVPFVLWEGFSLVYYGALVPNTAYAKLGTGISAADLARQGLHYFAHSLRADPLTPLTMLLGAAQVACLRRLPERAALGLGVLLYAIYVVKVGGDFMEGRFFTAPFFLSVLALSQWEPLPGPRLAAVLCLLVAAIGFATPHVPLLSDASFGTRVAGFKDEHGVGNERQFYYRHSGLLRYRTGVKMPTHEFARLGRAHRRRRKPFTVIHGAVGFCGFFAGPLVHIIDDFALTDPLLSRLPAKQTKRWRIGHFARVVPEGYKASATGEKNLIRDPGMAALFEDVKRVTRGPLWDRERWRAIWRLHTRH